MGKTVGSFCMFMGQTSKGMQKAEDNGELWKGKENAFYC